MNYKPYLRWTYAAASVIFVGLVAWNLYFADEFDPFREPYSGAFQDRQTDSVEVSGSNETEEPNNEQNTSNTNHSEETQPSIGVYGVSSVHPLAADVGMEVMENGGNAVDAAVAISFMLNVVEPYGSGIGGGGLMLVHDPEEGILSYDYREAAAESIDAREGENASPRGVAVPGLVRGMEMIYENHAELPWDQLLDPAIDTAREGFDVGNVLHQTIGNASRRLNTLDDRERENFFPGGQPIEVNDTLVQNDLADTLEIIKNEGAAGFYEGDIGQAIIDELRRHGQATFEEDDFNNYEAQMTEPVSAEVGGQTVHGGPSPSSGAVVVQALQMAERIAEQSDVSLEELTNEPEHEAAYTHMINEITRITYASRLDALGDPEFDDIDHERLTDDEYIDTLVDNFSEEEIGETDTDLFDTPSETADARHTTHFVVVDNDGRMVSATHSLGEFFGSGFYTNGFFLNNQVDNFSPDPESINRHEPGKRPRTFVAPMIFEEQGRPVLGMGSPGGRRIPAMVLQTIMRYQHGLNDDGESMSLQEAIQHPRFYNEDNVIYVEDTDFDPEAAEELRNMNYSIIEHTSPLFYGGIQGLGLTLDEDGNVSGMYGGGDPRRNGSWQIESAE
ncbi:gamma-glutamyltransferase family protein [Alkalicoccus luteus]|uniref:Gamma-glutamyltransferase n=1 Tax=Alkalicoccus luteus TaxID=1237094 RepID=A0A969TVU5_9BACI|nr:gamma-glutamyltransferase [Alkalicoccus luteus]NJP38482.1 gamma-glutamyltransferase [Alkalicoccus luteus]